MSVLGTILDWLLALLRRPRDPRPAALTLTQGPPQDEHPPVALRQMVASGTGQGDTPMANGTVGSNTWDPHDSWDLGWWRGARRTPAFSGRVGPHIVPRCVVVHTTDTMPGGFNAIVRSWQNTLGPGCCAHFMIGRGPEDGVVQFCSIMNNGNHAGGPVVNGMPRHGWWKFAQPDGGYSGLVHPNLIAVGIEIDCGGALQKITNPKDLTRAQVIHPDTKRVVPFADVFWDPDGRPWHKVTEYQLEVLRQLLRDLGPCLKPLPLDTVVVPDGDYKANGVPWAGSYRNDLVGHVTLDPVGKTDPGSQVYQWLKVNFPERLKWD